MRHIILLVELLTRLTKKKKKEIPVALKLYGDLLKAENCRVVLLTGTPIINYPNEIGILINILRGYIKTCNFILDTTVTRISKELLLEIFAKEKSLDYIDYIPSSKTLSITRNPYGFDNKITQRTGYKGVTNEKKEKKKMMQENLKEMKLGI